MLEASFGMLERLGRSGKDWLVQLPDRWHVRVATSAAVTHPLGATEASMVASARRFLGLDYLWAGTSGFGLLGPHAHAVPQSARHPIPRDSADQARSGSEQPRATAPR